MQLKSYSGLLLVLCPAMFAATPFSAHERSALLEARQAVWQAWFANDQKALGELLPEDTLAINNGEDRWQNRAEIMAAAQEFKRTGGKLLSLKFSRTEVRQYGDVAILYSVFEMTTEAAEQRTTVAGRATEVFVRRNGRWLNPGWHLDSGK
jgi:uncharacterized protein (TIGR02246 family)